MDVEQIQKINNLALELMKQGLVPDRETAIAEAEKMCRSKDSEQYNTLRQTIGEIKSTQEPVKVENEEIQEELSQPKIQEILKQNTEFLVKTIRSFQEKVVELEKELKELKTKVQYNRLPTVRDVVQPRASPPLDEQSSTMHETPTPQEKPVQQVAAAPPAQNSHPRSGNYNGDDVSIEKFFYMGSK